jgi:ElaB/YqjD/DUF883 family membrane-anchored ribosome-binding protein
MNNRCIFTNERNPPMSMTIPVTGTEAEEKQVTRKKLMEDLKTVVVDAEELLKKATADQAREWVATVRTKAERSLKAANDWLAEEEEAINAKTKAIARAAKDTLRTDIWKVVGIAAAAGILVGFLAIRFGWVKEDSDDR